MPRRQMDETLRLRRVFVFSHKRSSVVDRSGACRVLRDELITVFLL